MQFAVALALLLVVSPRARRRSRRGLLRSPIAFALVATVLAMWLSLGPMPNAGESRVSGLGLYGVLYDYVPGFNGVRVPARYAMIAGLFLAVLAGFGARAFLRKSVKPSAVRPSSSSVRSVLILVEGAAIPMEINRTWNQNEAMPPARVDALRAAGPAGLRARRGAAGRHRRSPSSRSATPRGRSVTSTTPPRTGSRSPTATAAASRRATRSASRGCSASPRIPKRRGSRCRTPAPRTSSFIETHLPTPPTLMRLRIG